MHKQHLISIQLSLGSYSQFCQEIARLCKCSRSEYVCVANVHMLVEAQKDKEFADIVNNAVITTPDGLPLTWGLRLLYGIKQDRVAGMDLLPDLLSSASQNQISIFFYGGTDDVLTKTELYVKQYYPDIPLTGFYSPPFRALTTEETDEIVEKINGSRARLVFVSLGCPKQEKWMSSMKGRINAVMIGIGAALPVLVGEQGRAPKWMQKKGMEWLYRLIQEPGRLWKRYLVTNTIYICILVREIISTAKNYMKPSNKNQLNGHRNHW